MIQLALGMIELLLLTFNYYSTCGQKCFLFYKQKPVQE